MSKINIPPVTGGFNLSQINSNFDQIEQHLNDRILYRDVPIGEPNQMLNDLDMNSKHIYNLPKPELDHEPARFKEIKEIKSVEYKAQEYAETAKEEADRAKYEADRAFQSAVYGGANDLKIFNDYSSASFAAATLADGQAVEAPDVDGKVSRYEVVGGALVFTGFVDQLRYDLESVNGGDFVSYAPSSVFLPREISQIFGDHINVKNFGAIGDGLSHPLSERYATIADAKAVYPHAIALTDEIDWAACQAALNSLKTVLATGAGGLVYVPTGVHMVNRTLTVPFNGTFFGSGPDEYASRFVARSDFIGSWVIKHAPAEGLSFNVGRTHSIGINCSDVPGLGGVHGWGFYHNSSIRDIYIRNVAGNAHGILIDKLNRAGAVGVAESVVIENVYAMHTFPVSTTPVTKAAIKLVACQECTLINVKGFNSTNGGTPVHDCAIEFEDCRGITMIGGAAVGAVNGIKIRTNIRNSTGITLVGVTYEMLSSSGCRLLVRGGGGYFVSGVREIGPRIEVPGPTIGIDIEYTVNSTFDNINNGAIIGEGVTGVCINDNGGGVVTAVASARYQRNSTPNAITSYSVTRPGISIEATNTPLVRLAVDGRTGAWVWRWSASSTVDNGAQMVAPGGSVPLLLGEIAGVPRLGFFGSGPISRPTVTGSKGGNAALGSLITALTNLGLIDNTTT